MTRIDSVEYLLRASVVSICSGERLRRVFESFVRSSYSEPAKRRICKKIDIVVKFVHVLGKFFVLQFHRF